MKKFAVLLLLVLFGCDSPVGNDPAPKDQLKAEIDGLYECIYIPGYGCQTGEQLSLDSLVAGYMVARGSVVWADHYQWFLEWSACRKSEQCSSSRAFGPFAPAAQPRQVEITVGVTADTYWLILEARLERYIRADTLQFTAAEPEEPEEK